MSFKDLRSFTEMMRALGYPRLISLENFRQSNFSLVSEILQWLVKRYDPNVELPFDTETEQDRVLFIKSVVQFMAAKAHIKLNTKKLYVADGYAVKELLKISSLLHEAMKSRIYSDVDVSAEEDSMDFNFNITTKLRDLKMTRQIASEITLKGASLFDLLGKEMELREVRSSILSKQLDIQEVEQNLRNATKAVEDEIEKTSFMIENIASDEANLESKIEKKKIDLERNQKRLVTLKSVRPAFMDEYERLEQELELLYEKYAMKFYWLTYFEQQLEELEKMEQELTLQREEMTRKTVEKLRQEEMLRSVENSALDDFVVVDDENDDSSSSPRQKLRRPQPATSGVRRETNRRIFGSMSGGDRDDSLDSDSDLDLEDDEESEASADDQELDLSEKKSAPATNSILDATDDF